MLVGAIHANHDIQESHEFQFFFENKPDTYYVNMEPHVPEDFPYDRIGQTEDYPWGRYRYSVLIYDWPGRYLWGMTAKIVERFAAILQ